MFLQSRLKLAVRRVEFKMERIASARSLFPFNISASSNSSVGRFLSMRRKIASFTEVTKATRVHHYFVRQRLYVLQALVPNNVPRRENISTFLNSFRLLTKPK
jgi:hypothetical protein